MSLLEWFDGWWRPTLAVPTRPAAVARPELPNLVGYCNHGRIVLVTPLGDIPIPPGCRVTVLEVQHAVAWICGLPELEPGSRRA